MPELKPQVYKDPRPAEEFTRFHERARTHEPDWVYDVARMMLTPPTLLLYRARAIGAEHVPASGAVVLAPNHFSQWDHFFAGVYLRRRIRFMAKSQLFSNPVIKFIFWHGGPFPIRRGHQDEEAFKTVYEILDRGGCLLMYPEGGRSRTGGLGEPRPGVGRIALESGVPVVPVAIHGSHGRARLAPAQLPQGHRAVRGADAVRRRGLADARAAARGRRRRSSAGCARCTRRSRRRAGGA